MLTAEEEYGVNCIEQQTKFCLSLHYKGVSSYMFANSVEIYKFKAKDLEINEAPLCLGNFSKDFSADNKKRQGYTDMYMIFQSIMTVLMLLIFWVFTSI